MRLEYRLYKTYSSCTLLNDSLPQVVLNSINASLQQSGKHQFQRGAGRH